MPRDRANIRVDMWNDDDWRGLTGPAQHLYQKLLTHPSLTYCGVADWRPGRLAALTRGMTAQDVRDAAAELQCGAFVYVDEDSEEVFIRSFVRHDGLLKQPRLPISMANDFAGVASTTIRRFFVWELRKLRDEDPTMKAWEDKRIQSILKRDAADLKEFCQAKPESYGKGFAEGYGKEFAEGYAKTDPSVSANPTANDSDSDQMRTTTATATATSPKGDAPPSFRNYVTEDAAPRTQRDLMKAAGRIVNGFLDGVQGVTFPSKIRSDLTANVTVSLQDNIPAEHIVQGLKLWNDGGYPASTLPSYVLQAQRQANGQPAPGAQPRARRATGTEKAMAAIALAEQMQAGQGFGELTDGN